VFASETTASGIAQRNRLRMRVIDVVRVSRA